MFMIFWALLGALIGVSAAQRRGFSVVAGILGGLFLGPLAFLMYWVSGVTLGDESRRFVTMLLVLAGWLAVSVVVEVVLFGLLGKAGRAYSTVPGVLLAILLGLWIVHRRHPRR